MPRHNVFQPLFVKTKDIASNVGEQLRATRDIFQRGREELGLAQAEPQSRRDIVVGALGGRRKLLLGLGGAAIGALAPVSAGFLPDLKGTEQRAQEQRKQLKMNVVEDIITNDAVRRYETALKLINELDVSQEERDSLRLRLEFARGNINF